MSQWREDKCAEILNSPIDLEELSISLTTDISKKREYYLEPDFLQASDFRNVVDQLMCGHDHPFAKKLSIFDGSICRLEVTVLSNFKNASKTKTKRKRTSELSSS